MAISHYASYIIERDIAANRPASPVAPDDKLYIFEASDTGAISIWSKGATAWKDIDQIDDESVTYAKIQNVSATDKVLGRSTAGAGDVEEITCTAAGRALLDDADAAAQRTTLGLGTAAVETFTQGTFTPTFTFATPGDLSLSSVTAAGVYFKIGNLVVFFLRYTATPTFTTASGTAIFGGLPATSANNNTRGGGTFSNIDKINITTGFQIGFQVNPNATTCFIYEFKDNATSTVLSSARFTSGQTFGIVVNGFYEAA